VRWAYAGNIETKPELICLLGKDLKQKPAKHGHFGALARGDQLSFAISELKFFTYVPKTLCLSSKSHPGECVGQYFSVPYELAALHSMNIYGKSYKLYIGTLHAAVRLG
jgi:hypothetical protein